MEVIAVFTGGGVIGDVNIMAKLIAPLNGNGQNCNQLVSVFRTTQ